MQPVIQESKAGRHMQVDIDYLNGKWVPSYYGHRFTIARKDRAGGERDTSFIVPTLGEAQSEAERRNVAEAVQ